jgi:hypothetical protein
VKVSHFRNFNGMSVQLVFKRLYELLKLFHCQTLFLAKSSVTTPMTGSVHSAHLLDIHFRRVYTARLNKKNVSTGIKTFKLNVLIYRRSVDIPEGSFLTVKNFSFKFVSFLVHFALGLSLNIEEKVYESFNDN